MAETTFSRKLDSMGRIMIPVKLREQVGLITGNEYFFSVKEIDGRRYICIDCGTAISPNLEQAMKIIEANGMRITKE